VAHVSLDDPQVDAGFEKMSGLVLCKLNY
jgi:hypothetical protein